MDGLTEGRDVHFVLPDGQHRAAKVVRVWNKETGYVNLLVFRDGFNDPPVQIVGSVSLPDGPVIAGIPSFVSWETSVSYNDTDMPPRTWHWIERA